MSLIECCLGLAAAVGAFAFPTLGSQFSAATERHFQNLARRRGMAVLLAGLTALRLRPASLEEGG